VLEPEPVADPVYDAPQEDPFAQNDAPTDEYAMAAEAPAIPAAAPGAGGEARRPCPMCGEMIAASAMKCRFCGTVFDKRLKAVAGGSTGDPGWRTVRKGLRTIYVSIGVIFIAAIALGVLSGVAGASMGGGAGPGAASSALVLVLIPALVILGAAIAVIVGQFMCCAVPAETGAKNFALIAAVCIIINIVCSMASAVVPPAQALGSIASLTGNVLFILFIRKVALYLGNTDLASSAMKFLIFLAVIVAAVVALVVMAIAAQEKALFGLMGLLFVVAAIVALVWYLRLLAKTVETIDGGGRGVRPSGFPVVQR
jgi:hypothetical protein